MDDARSVATGMAEEGLVSRRVNVDRPQKVGRRFVFLAVGKQFRARS